MLFLLPKSSPSYLNLEPDFNRVIIPGLHTRRQSVPAHHLAYQHTLQPRDRSQWPFLPGPPRACLSIAGCLFLSVARPGQGLCAVCCRLGAQPCGYHGALTNSRVQLLLWGLTRVFTSKGQGPAFTVGVTHVPLPAQSPLRSRVPTHGLDAPHSVQLANVPPAAWHSPSCRSRLSCVSFRAASSTWTWMAVSSSSVGESSQKAWSTSRFSRQ